MGDRLRALGHEVYDEGDLIIQGPESQKVKNPKLRFLHYIAEACEELSTRVNKALGQGYLPLVLGGDHSMSIGSIAGISAYCREQDKTLGVLWIDGHADINDEQTTLSGNIHGMPAAVSLGVGAEELVGIGGFAPKLQPENLIYIGLRDLDPGEVERVHSMGIEYYSMHEVDKLTMPGVIDRALPPLLRRCDHLHVSFDADSLDPRIAPGVGTPVEGGLTYREAHLIMELIATTGRLSSLEVAEVNPVLDEHNRTADMMAGLVASALGQRIL